MSLRPKWILNVKKLYIRTCFGINQDLDENEETTVGNYRFICVMETLEAALILFRIKQNKKVKQTYLEEICRKLWISLIYSLQLFKRNNLLYKVFDCNDPKFFYLT